MVDVACYCPNCAQKIVGEVPALPATVLCPTCQYNFELVRKNQGFWGDTIFKVLTFSGLLLGVYKIGQALTDSEYSGRTLPQHVKNQLKADHISRYGERCPSCDMEASWPDLVVDHIVPYAERGRTSVKNIQVICRTCNYGKSDKLTLLDFLRGRGGRGT